LISSIADGASPLSWAFVKIYEFKEIGIAILAAITAGMAFVNFKRIAKQAKGE